MNLNCVPKGLNYDNFTDRHNITHSIILSFYNKVISETVGLIQHQISRIANRNASIL